MAEQKRAMIIGAGPAGLTAAYELATRSSIQPLVLEASPDMGGISKTVNYKGNRIDIGGHRFFSKSDIVMKWWTDLMPIETTPDGIGFTLRYRGQHRQLLGGEGVDPQTTDEVMLVRSRLSRIYYLRRFFNYPVKLEMQTLRNLGWARLMRIGLSYLWARLFPRPEKSLEDFYINRFGQELYKTFFRDYTQKVWGVPCNQIAPDWGPQRVKGLSITQTLLHAVRSWWRKPGDLAQKDVETSLIEYFLYPKLGPGQMWDTVARQVQQRGGVVETGQQVVRLHLQGKRVQGVTVRSTESGEERYLEGDYFLSTMPVSELVASLEGVSVPPRVAQLARELPFRDFITVGLLLKKLKIESLGGPPGRVPDNWIYIQEPQVKVGRLQIFNNWSPYLVADPDTVWLGLEYFVNEGDSIWNLSDEEMARLGVQELSSIGIIDPQEVLDHTVLRVKKTYPAYFGSYAHFGEIRQFLDGVENLFLIGRNGMHRYNNQDHSMLTAMAAVENILNGRTDKSNIWDVNVEQDYHEEKK